MKLISTELFQNDYVSNEIYYKHFYSEIYLTLVCNVLALVGDFNNFTSIIIGDYVKIFLNFGT